MKKLVQLKKNYYNYLDRKARHVAYRLCRNKSVTSLLLDYISELYDSAQIVKERCKVEKKFESAYHSPITSELEFLIARTLYHYSNFKKLGWTVYLRKQKFKTAPDIGIEKNKKIIAIIEVKAGAGWIQPFFSKEREEKDEQKGKKPKELIKRVRNQLLKYVEAYKINKDRIFVFIPTLAHVHRESYTKDLSNYERTFSENSTLEKKNLIILSKNLKLKLSKKCQRKDYKPTDRFEKFIKKLEKF